jgi:hypothetical protein
MSTTNQDPFIAQVLVLHAVGYERINYLLCQGLYTANQDSPLNNERIKID